MKQRNGFVSNSSSSSFVITKESGFKTVDVLRKMLVIANREFLKEGTTGAYKFKEIIRWIAKNPDFDEPLYYPGTCNFGTFICRSGGFIDVDTCNNHDNDWESLSFHTLKDTSVLDIETPCLVVFLDVTDMREKTLKEIDDEELKASVEKSKVFDAMSAVPKPVEGTTYGYPGFEPLNLTSVPQEGTPEASREAGYYWVSFCGSEPRIAYYTPYSKRPWEIVASYPEFEVIVLKKVVPYVEEAVDKERASPAMHPVDATILGQWNEYFSDKSMSEMDADDKVWLQKLKKLGYDWFRNKAIQWFNNSDWFWDILVDKEVENTEVDR